MAGRLFIVVVIALAFAAPVAAQEPTPSEQAALEVYREGGFSRAVQLYTKALSEAGEPSHRAQIHIHIAWTLFALGREGEVGTHLRAALVENPSLTLDPDYYTSEFLELFEAARREPATPPAHEGGAPAPDLEATLSSIQQRLDDGTDLEAALADVNRLRAAYPREGRLAPLAIQILEALGRAAEAEQVRQQLRAGGSLPSGDGGLYVETLSIPDLILRANRLLDQGELDSSLALLREAVDRQPTNVAALELLAEGAQRAGQWQEAEFALKSALGLQPDNIGLKLRLGEVYLAMDDVSAARDVFRQLTDEHPHSDRAWAARGLLNARLGLPDRALEELAEALQENPLLPEVQLAYGELLLAQRRTGEALEALRSASNLLQGDAQVEARLGQALLARGDSERALAHLRTAVAGDFEPPDVAESLAMALIANGLLAEAQRALSDPALENARETDLLRGVLALERGELDQAFGILRAVAEDRPNDPAVLNLLAATIYRQGRFEESASLLVRAVELAPANETLLANLGQARAAAAAERLKTQARTTEVNPQALQ